MTAPPCGSAGFFFQKISKTSKDTKSLVFQGVIGENKGSLPHLNLRNVLFLDFCFKQKLISHKY